MEEPLPTLPPERLLQHAGALRRLARRLVRDDAEADDLVQETWTSVLEKPRTDEPASGWKRWLFGVARNIARERRRSEGRRARREQAASRSESTTDGSEIVEQLETFRMLADELSRLEEPYRATLYRRFFENHSNARIAEEDGIAEASVRSRTSRGVALLRERLERRKPDGRGSWVLLLRRIAGDEPAQATLRTAPWFALAAMLIVTVVVVAVVGSGRSSKLEEPDVASTHGEHTGSAPLVVASTTLDDPRFEDSAGSARVTLAPARADETASLRLVDLRTQEPLAGYELRVGVIGGAAGRTAVTHADGSVDLPSASGAFDLGLTLIDDLQLDVLRRAHSGARSFPWTLPPLHFAPGSEACTLRVAVGPRFEIRFDPPLRVALESLHAELVASDAGSTRASSTAPLRAPLGPEGLPWVRFLDEATYLGGPPPFRLRVCDEAGLLCGESDVSALVGAQREPVTIRLESRGALDVHVFGADGRACPARLTLSVAGRAPVRAASDADGAKFRWIPAEAVQIRVEAEGLDPLVVPARVVADQTMDQDIVVQRAPGVGAISGRALASVASVRFDIEHEITHERRETTGSTEAGSAAFEFARVPAGRWTLRAHAAGIWRWNPPGLDVTAPASGLVLTPLAVANVRAIKIRAFDERTGDRIDHFEAGLQCDGVEGERQTKTTGFGNLVFESVPQDAALAWNIAAEGYLPAHGDRTAIEHPGDMDLIRVKLSRGWQRDVEVRDASTHAPLPGVRVIVDDALAGMTDDKGSLTLQRASAPHHITVELAGRHLVGGSIESDGTYASQTPWTITAQLTR